MFGCLLAIVIVFLAPQPSDAFMSEAEVAALQESLKEMPKGERIAFWAEKFIGTPYDPDPKGEYVTKNLIVSDERVDCMYHTFRSVELAMGTTPEEAVSIALEKRFTTKGRLDDIGFVENYEERFQYGEDMIESGKWGKEITDKLGAAIEIRGSRGRPSVNILTGAGLLEVLNRLKSGDIVFFIKDPDKRIAGEIVGHMGIVKIQPDGIRLMHASGMKGKGGEVVKVLLSDYLRSMPFIGARVSRFD